MLHCDLTLSTPEENLACDEALLDLCEETAATGVLRFWEPIDYAVVLGYANRAATEVNLAFCRAEGIRVLRRCTGGGTVLQGPGCLNYSLVLPIDGAIELRGVSTTNTFILNRHRKLLSELLNQSVETQGHTDLAIGGLKFSGNAQRRRQRSVLFHGTFLLQMAVEEIEKALPFPSHQPDYRENRSHRDFLTNLETSADRVKEALRHAWNADRSLAEIPSARIAELVRTKYSLDSWNLKF